MKLLNFVLLLSLLGGTALADRPATHGMLLFGDKVTYASHLPMFHSPHDYQVLLQLDLRARPGVSTLEKYDAAKRHGETLFTIEPELMDLTQVTAGTKTSFSADLYVGHFERGGKNLGPVQIEVRQVIYSAKLNASGPAPSSDTYLVFGQEGEYFAAHLIDERPSFDLIAKVGQAFRPAPCRTRLCEPANGKFISDTSLPLQVTQDKGRRPQEGVFLGSRLGPQAEVASILYFEENDLAH